MRGVGEVVDARHLRALEDAALVGRVGVERPVPVEVVGRDVEHRGRLRGHRVREVQLEARQLDGEDVERRVGRREHHGRADVADRRRRSRPAARRIDSSMPTVVVLPLVPGDREPRRRAAAGRAVDAHVPRELDLAPHGQRRAPAAAASSGWCGASPGDATTRSARSSTVPASSSAEPMTSSAWSSTGTTRAPRDASTSAAARPETPSPATTTRAPSSTSVGHLPGHPLGVEDARRRARRTARR